MARKAGYLLALFYLFITYSRVIEVAVPSLRITALVYATALGLAVVSGGFMPALSHRIGRFLAAFAIWLVIATPFSIWKGGSVAALIELLRNLPVYFIVAGLIWEFGEVRTAIHTLAYAILTLAILALLLGGQMDGRLMLATGKFANPNDFAQALLIGMPFWWLMATRYGGGPIRRLAAFPAFAVIAYAMGLTGSRAALLATAGAGLVFFLHVSFPNKLKLAAAAVAAFMLAIIVLPGSLRARYLTIFEPDESGYQSLEQDGPSLEKALGSKEGRVALLRSSLQITFANPLLGAGPGMFQVAEQKLAEAEGRSANWHETHNAFTQASSEAGLPALVFFTAVLVLSIRTSHRLHKRCSRDPALLPLAHTALALETTLAAYTVTAFFSSVAYSNLLPTLAGLTVALERAVAAATASAEKAKTQEPVALPRRRRPSLRAQAMRLR